MIATRRPISKLALGEGRQRIEVIDDVLGMIDADGLFALDAQLLRPLRSGGHDHGAKTHVLEILERQRLILPHHHMTQIKYFRVGENSFELFAQTGLHLFLVDKDAVLGQTARFDVAIDQDHPMPASVSLRAP